MSIESDEQTPSLDFGEYFARRKTAEDKLEKEFEDLGEKLFALVPPELRPQMYFFFPEPMGDDPAGQRFHFLFPIKNWLKETSYASRKGSYTNLPGGRLTSEDLMLLKQAWKGIIDVELCDEDKGVEGRFRIPVSGKHTATPDWIAREVKEPDNWEAGPAKKVSKGAAPIKGWVRDEIQKLADASGLQMVGPVPTRSERRAGIGGVYYKFQKPNDPESTSR